MGFTCSPDSLGPVFSLSTLFPTAAVVFAWMQCNDRGAVRSLSSVLRGASGRPRRFSTCPRSHPTISWWWGGFSHAGLRGFLSASLLLCLSFLRELCVRGRIVGLCWKCLVAPWPVATSTLGLPLWCTSGCCEDPVLAESYFALYPIPLIADATSFSRVGPSSLFAPRLSAAVFDGNVCVSLGHSASWVCFLPSGSILARLVALTGPWWQP